MIRLRPFLSLLLIPLPVVYHFLFDVDPLWDCLIIFSSVSPRFLYLILMLSMLLLVICSYPSSLQARTIVVCVSVSFVLVSPFDLNPVWRLHFSSSVFSRAIIPFLLRSSSNVLLRTEILIEWKLVINCSLFGSLHICLSTFYSVKMLSWFYIEYLLTVYLW